MSLSIDTIISKAEKSIKKNNFFEAEKLYNSVLAKFPNNIRAKNGIKNIKKLYFNSKTYSHNLPDVIYNELIILIQNNLFDVVLKKVQKIEAKFKDSFELYNFMGIALYHLNKNDEAIDSFTRSIHLNSNFYESFNNIGNCFQKKNQLHNAVNNFKKSIDINPNFFQGYYNLANCYKRLNEFDLSEKNYLNSIKLSPNNIDAYYNLGNLYSLEKKHTDSIRCFESILKIDGNHNLSLSQKIHQQLHIGEWSLENKTKLIENICVHNKPAIPFDTLSIVDDVKIHQKASQLYVKDKFSNMSFHNRCNFSGKKEIIRIGYFSSDFYNHATMHLMINIFEHHNQNNFKIFLYDYGTNRPDEMTERIKKKPVVYKKIDNFSDSEIFTIVRQDEIDIAVDLKGYTGGGRPELFYQRVAPIQVNYLGFPGTIGFNQMDYIIGDSIVIPEEHNPYYNEKIIRLPNCYQINNNDRFIPKKKFSNNELGLPNQGFVFCNFNNNYKINQEVFDIWIKLLKNIDNSVLWLLETNSIMKNKLLDYATSKGISKNRIVFAPKININDHLSRHLNADLFLDTFVYNAHTTGSDSLWCGVPIITKLGSSFPARVGASLLNGVNLKKFITKTSEEYYQLAYYYSQNTLELKKIKDDLIQNRKKFPLFNSKLFCKNIEIAFRLMVNNYQNKKSINLTY